MSAASHLRLVTPPAPDSIPVSITRFKSPSDTKTREESNTTWGGIVRGLENVAEHASKGECPMFAGATFGDKAQAFWLTAPQRERARGFRHRRRLRW